MYEVFLNEKKIVITQPGNISFVKETVKTENLHSVEGVKNWFLDFAASKTELAVLTHPSPVVFWTTLFLPVFKLIPAAGGIVFRNNKLLFIYRNGKWDLPKGKIDKGETTREAAIREVAEECGIEGHRITKVLPSTFHAYQLPYAKSHVQWILKETHWFEMIYANSFNGTPQIKENITEIRWFEKNELDEVFTNTYENLKSAITNYMK